MKKLRLALLALCAVLLLAGCAGNIKIKEKSADSLANEVLSQLDEMYRNDNYIKVYFGEKTYDDIMNELRKTPDLSAPAKVYSIKLDNDLINTNIENAGQDLSDNLKKDIKKRLVGSIPNMRNSKKGAAYANLAGILNASCEGYCPEIADFDVRLYVYENGYPVILIAQTDENGLTHFNACPLFEDNTNKTPGTEILEIMSDSLPIIVAMKEM